SPPSSSLSLQLVCCVSRSSISRIVPSKPQTTTIMFPTISETRFTGAGGSLSLHYQSNPAAGNATAGPAFPPSMIAGRRPLLLSEEEQHLYNHHIIENFVESVREMNDVVLIPSKLKDLDPSVPAPGAGMKYVTLNDDLFSYFQMINVVKNDLF